MGFFKGLIFFLLILILLSLPPLLSVWAGHSFWAGALVSCALMALLLLGFFVRALWLRHREKKFIDGILEQKEPAQTDKNGELSGELARRWKEAVRELKKSHLRQKGNPLYVLPWYMLIGESGSGKTTAIKNAKLRAGFSSLPRVSGVSGTKNCDWWFFEEAIIIDTAGRYAIQPDETSDKSEWHLFLSQLARYRKKEPLNGLLVTLSADRILTLSKQDLEEEGRKIRLRIEELMQSLGAKFPVYLLVTKCDLIRGMTEFCDALSPAAHDQAFGYLDPDPEKDRDRFLDRAFDSLMEPLRRFRLRIANSDSVNTVSPDVLLFPEEFGMLKQGLAPFVQAAFNQNSYQEIPLLRGMYFTSGRQSGEPVSHFIRTLKLKPGTTSPPPSNKSYFLHDVFRYILPGDRQMFSTTQRTQDYRRKTRTMGFAAWAMILAVFCGLLSFSFALTLSSIKQVRTEFSKPPQLSGELIPDLNRLEQLRRVIVKIESRNRNRWLPRFGLNHCDAIERDLKALFCSSFGNHFLATYDGPHDEAALAFTGRTPGPTIGASLSLYARRLALMEGALNGESLARLEARIQPDFRPLVFPGNRPVIPEALALLENQYRHYLTWEEVKALTQRFKQTQDRFRHLMVDKKIPFDWMITWAHAQGSPITLGDFWKGSGSVKDEAIIKPAFTTKGFETIRQMLDECEKALGQPLLMEGQKKDFLRAYRQAYLDSWSRFTRSFPGGAFTLTGKEQHQATTQSLGTPANPYFLFMDRLSTELEPWQGEEQDTPAWIPIVLSYDDIRRYEQNGKPDPGSSLTDALAKKGARMLGKVGRLAAASSSPETLMVSAEIFARYRQALEAMSKACASAPASFRLASQVFVEDPANGESSLAAARRAADELKRALASHEDSQNILARLVDGPIDYLWSRVTRRGACQLQAIWEETVLAEVQGVHDRKLMADMLLGKEGYVTAFTSGPGAPFLGRDRKRGYYAKKVDGEAMAVTPAFLSFLTRGAYSAKSAQNLYKVKMEGLPTDTNPDATMMPHVTKLELECAAGIQSLDNYNYPVSHTFEWSPTECGDVALNILIGNLTLKKTYTGFRPFARFLKDFEKGQHTFYRIDFPDMGPELKRMGIKFIKVKYKISGGGPVMRLLNMEAGRAPEEIVSCLD